MGVGSALSESGEWRTELLAIGDEPLIGCVLAACSQLMLPYWELHNPLDEKMGRVMSALAAWTTNPTTDSRSKILNTLRQVAVESRGSLSPVWRVPPGSDCPGDYAGDSIVAAANAITEIGRPDFSRLAEACLENAAHTVSQMMGQREPDDELTDFWAASLEHLRRGIIRQLQLWEMFTI